ncbi:unnamed protein product [Mucor hiemalis]
MAKPKLPNSISKKYKVPEKVRVVLQLEPFILTGQISNFCDPLEHINVIPIRTLAKLDLKHLYNDLIEGIYSLSTLDDKEHSLNADTKEYLKDVYAYCSKKTFEKKMIQKANMILKENEEYLNTIKIKEAKKRTAQEAELLGVDMTCNSIKHYRAEALTDVSNTNQNDQYKPQPRTSSTVNSQNTSSNTNELGRLNVQSNSTSSINQQEKNLTMQKNQKRFILNSALSCLSAPHKPKVQKVDRKTIADLCSLGIECLVDDELYKDTDAMKEFKENCSMQERNSSLLEVCQILDFLDDVLNCPFGKFPHTLWSHPVHDSTDTDTNNLANIISYTLTDFHCNCKQPMVTNSNHERTPFVDYVIPMFKYLAKETGLLDFSWCEKLVETQKYAQIAEVDYEAAGTDRKYADGLGKSNNSETLFIESSSGLLQENISHTLEDTLKLLVECNGALCYILSHFKNSRFETALKKSTFGVQVIKDTITLSKMNLKGDKMWKFVEIRSATIPTSWSDRFSWVKMFELIATLFLCLREEEQVDMELKKENAGLNFVPKEETLAALLSFPEL